MGKIIYRSDKTQKIYDRRARHVLRHYQNETGLEWQDDPMSFVDWVMHRKETGNWKKSTWRMTRIALRERLQKEKAPIECIEKLWHGENPLSTVKGSYDTSRVRGLPEDDLKKLLDATENPEKYDLRGGGYDKMLGAFLKNNVLIGLRPSEWDTARLAEVEGETVILVENRKTGNGRSNGTQRILHIKKEFIERFRMAFEERDRLYFMGIDWPEIQKGMEKRLRNIRSILGGKTYTLYSTRHRFASALKKLGFSRKEIADMMGHNSDETASLHYGKLRSKIFGGQEDKNEVQNEISAVTRGEGVHENLLKTNNLMDKPETIHKNN